MTDDGPSNLIHPITTVLPPGIDAKYVDSHCHIDLILDRAYRKKKKSFKSYSHMASHWPSELDAAIWNVVFPSSFIALDALADIDPDPRLFWTVGLHPTSSSEWSDDFAKMLEQRSTHTRCVGIGECGLDYFRKGPGSRQSQLAAFRAQCLIAARTGKALVIHMRAASDEKRSLDALLDDIVDTLCSTVPNDHPIHMHCFNQPAWALDRFNEFPEMKFGFTAKVTYDDEPPLSALERCPLDKILLETDSPFFTPKSLAGVLCHPGLVGLVASKIAEVKSRVMGEPVSTEQVVRIARANTRTVYKI
eukprot:Selendium_serpulae@DN3007_c0_g1_i1.p1